MSETEGPADLANKKNDTPDIEFDMSRVNLWMALFRLGANAGTVADSNLVGRYIDFLESERKRLTIVASIGYTMCIGLVIFGAVFLEFC